MGVGMQISGVTVLVAMAMLACSSCSNPDVDEPPDQPRERVAIVGTPYFVESEWDAAAQQVRTRVSTEDGEDVVRVDFRGRRILHVDWPLENVTWHGELSEEPAWHQGYPWLDHADLIGVFVGAAYGGHPLHQPGKADAPGCCGIRHLVPDTDQSECVLECCAIHDKCFKDNDCTMVSLAWSFGAVGPYVSACARCNEDVVACLAACALGGEHPDRPDYYCAEDGCGCFYGDEDELRDRCKHICGNGDVEPNYGEQCDPPDEDPSCEQRAAGYCSKSCLLVERPRRCGDDCADPGEECREPGLTCSAAEKCDEAKCVCREACGDGVRDPERGEDCDGAGKAQCPEQHKCNAECECYASCGDGVLDAGEECDNGIENSDVLPDACRSDCRKARCGDLAVDTGEQCDGVNQAQCAFGDVCVACVCDSTCGNDSVEPHEQCDPPGSACLDGIIPCSPSCTCPGCGNGVVEASEGCDPPTCSGVDAASCETTDLSEEQCGVGYGCTLACFCREAP